MGLGGTIWRDPEIGHGVRQLSALPGLYAIEESLSDATERFCHCLALPPVGFIDGFRARLG